MRRLAILVALALILGASLAYADGLEPVEGGYKGKTAQNQRVYFGVRGRTVVNPRWTVKWGFCGKQTQHLTHESAAIDGAAHFSFDAGQTAFEGTFVGPDLVEGTAIFLEHPLAGCPLRAIPFTAHLR